MITQPTIYLMWTGVIFQKITIFLCCFQSEWFWLNIKLSTAMNDIHPFKSNWSINNFQWYTSTLVFFFGDGVSLSGTAFMFMLCADRISFSFSFECRSRFCFCPMLGRRGSGRSARQSAARFPGGGAKFKSTRRVSPRSTRTLIWNVSTGGNDFFYPSRRWAVFFFVSWRSPYFLNIFFFTVWFRGVRPRLSNERCGPRLI